MRLLSFLAAAVLSAAFAVAAAAPASADPRSGDTRFTSLSLYIDGNGADRSTVVGNGGTVRLAASFRYRYYGEQPSAPRIRLQRYRSGTWATVAAGGLKVDLDADEAIAVRTKAYRTTNATERVRYRIVSVAYRNGAGAVTNTTASKPITVTYENQARYRGFRQRLWRDVQGYCPNTAIRVVDFHGSRAGEFDTGSLLLRVDSAIEGYPTVHRRAVALHECAHERQWLDYGASSRGSRAMEKAAAEVYQDDVPPSPETLPYPYEPAESFDPVEHGADCAAQAVSPGGYLGYGGYCNDEELQEGLALMQGERY